MSAGSTLVLRVYYEDTDASGVAYHTSYLRWFERGRTEWLRACGYGQQQLMQEHGVAFTLAEIQVRYRSPARLDDALEVHTAVLKLGRASLSFRQTLHGADGALLTEAEARVACVDSVRFQPIALPPDLLASLRHAELAN